jgi:hypothetical protein
VHCGGMQRGNSGEESRAGRRGREGKIGWRCSLPQHRASGALVRRWKAVERWAAEVRHCRWRRGQGLRSKRQWLRVLWKQGHGAAAL